MANFFDRLVQRAWQPETALQPRVLSAFEAPQVVELPVDPIASSDPATFSTEVPPAAAAADPTPAAPVVSPTPGERQPSARVPPVERRQRTEEKPGGMNVNPIATAPAPVVTPIHTAPPVTRRRRARTIPVQDAPRAPAMRRESPAVPAVRVQRSVMPGELPARAGPPAPDPLGATTAVTPQPRRDSPPVPPAPAPLRERTPQRVDRPRPRFERIVTAAPIEIARETPRAEPVIQVTIGRVEIRAVQSSRAEKRSATKSPALSLDAYLTQRNGGRQ